MSKIQFYNPFHQELFLAVVAQSSWREQLKFFKERGLKPWALLLKRYGLGEGQVFLLASVKLPEEEARNHVEDMGKTFRVLEQGSDPFKHLRV